ncbi:hypothetical protein G6F42_022941 [Rhizopus arrhizus]|nr:hypothetical protein G6F42_022941 [Rhizopus arrhizus]
MCDASRGLRLVCELAGDGEEEEEVVFCHLRRTMCWKGASTNPQCVRALARSMVSMDTPCASLVCLMLDCGSSSSCVFGWLSSMLSSSLQRKGDWLMMDLCTLNRIEKGNEGCRKTNERSENRDFSNMSSRRYRSNFEVVFLWAVILMLKMILILTPFSRWRSSHEFFSTFRWIQQQFTSTHHRLGGLLRHVEVTTVVYFSHSAIAIQERPLQTAREAHQLYYQVLFVLMP